METPPFALSPADLLANNRAWVAARTAADPEAFRRQAEGQAPPFLWIGCSDSRAPPEQIVGLGPGELFVHRNIANLVPEGDLNALSVLQYAVAVLRVRHILVVGHYGCGGVKAALAGTGIGLIDDWLAPIRDLALADRDELAALGSDAARQGRLCELNVVRQVRNVANARVVAGAWTAGQALEVHGWCYALDDGLITDLKVSVAGPSARP